MSTVFTAPRCRLLIEGKILVRATNFTIRASTEYQDIIVLDSIETVEHAPINYSVSGSIGKVIVVGSTPKSEGMFPQTGKDSSEHLLNILNLGARVIQVLDKKENNRVLHVITGVTFTDWDRSIGARSVGAENISWRGIRETDESEAGA